jgi:regulator of cell morphogenesis and NO signaling
MLLESIRIDRNSFIPDLVRQDYRTAIVFGKYDIDFSGDTKWTLGKACEMKGLEFDSLKKELENSVRTLRLSGSIPFDQWNVDFMTNYLVNIHHQYLRDVLPKIKEYLNRCVENDARKFPYFADVQKQFNYLFKDILPHLQQEEEILFPYIRQISHAYESKESYASLLVRTLRKPVEDVMNHEHETVSKVLRRIRELTNNYTSPENASICHQVAFSMLKELDDDLVQHVYLENDILFSKAVTMEKELLQR